MAEGGQEAWPPPAWGLKLCVVSSTLDHNKKQQNFFFKQSLTDREIPHNLGKAQIGNVLLCWAELVLFTSVSTAFPFRGDLIYSNTGQKLPLFLGIFISFCHIYFFNPSAVKPVASIAVPCIHRNGLSLWKPAPKPMDMAGTQLHLCKVT